MNLFCSRKKNAVAEASIAIEDKDDIEKTLYVLPASHSYTLLKKLDFASRSKRQVLTYAFSQVFTLVSQYESLFSDILKISMQKHPSIYI